MQDFGFLLTLAIILVSTKLLGVASAKVHMPQVVGALLAGIILGPSGFGVLSSTDFFVKAAEIGVIMLMFTAGIDTDMEELKHTGLQAFVVACMGVLIPLIMCGALYFFFFEGEFNTVNVLRASFVGSVFSATSVSITVETLNEMGKIKTRTGTTLLSAALIDDVLGIIVLSVLTGFANGSGNVLVVLLLIALFFVFVLVAGFVFHWVFVMISKEHWHSRRVAIWALAFAFLMAYCAEEFFGVADITGAFFAGLILCNISKSRQFVAKKITVSSYLLFAPVFFASVGMKTDLTTMNSSILLFALILAIFGVISKIAGCGLGAKVCGMTSHQSLVVGIGMVARSEVALMVAQKGIDAGMIDAKILPAIVLSVVVSGLVTPILLKAAISKGPELV
ncbi:MAG: cation:proton antiporter [Eubacteriales bacterium]|nr:cation:proton antiporter [Eubacteriales bacterium]